jgi:chromate transporter
MRPAVFAIVLIAISRFGKAALTSVETIVMASIAVLLAIIGIEELIIIFGLGLTLAIFKMLPKRNLSVSLELLLFFTKVGSVLFGSGYVLLAYLQKGLVEDRGLLTSVQLLDSITIGQVTPGPVFTTATFVGYLISGVEGATLSTIGIFLPSFLLVGIVAPFIFRLRQNAFLSTFLDGVNAASVGLMIHVLYILGRESLISIPSITLSAVTLFLHVKFPKINSAFLIVAGGLIFFLVKP